MPDKKYVNRSCPICVRPVRPSDDCQNCDHCRLSYHVVCWEAQGGCNSPGCPSAHPTSQEEDSPAASAETAPASQGNPAPVRGQAAQTLVVGALPTAPPSRPPESISPLWLQPVSLFVYAAVLMVVATVFLAMWKIRQKQAERAFGQVVAGAQATEDPRESARIYDDYISTHPQNEISRQAHRKRDEARSRVAAYEFGLATKRADAAGEQYESAEQIVREYLETSPPPPYQEKAEARLRELPALIEARDYRLVEDRFPESSTDLQGRQAALQDFVARHPRGPHADAAQKALAMMADRLDEQALTELTKHVGSLRSAGRYKDALGLIDADGGKIKAEKRKKSLEELRRTLLEGQLNEEAKVILAMPTNTPVEQNQAISECHLFLLYRPGSPQAGNVKDFLETVSRQMQSAEWANVRSAIAAGPQDLVRCLDLIGAFQSRWPDLNAPEIATEIAAYHLRNLKEAWAEVDVIETGMLVRKDGAELSGRIERSNSSYRVIDDDSGKRSASIYSSQIKELRLRPGPGSFQDLTNAIQRLEPSKINPTDVRAVLATIDKSGLKRAGLLVRRFLLGINPRDKECAKAMIEAGARYARGRWLLPEEQSPKLRVQQVLENCQQKIVESAKFTVARLDLKVTYDFEDHAIQCSVAYASAEMGPISGPEQPLKATAQIVFTPTLRPRNDGPKDRAKDSEKANSGLNAALRRLERTLEFVADVAIEETPPNWLGMEIESAADGDAFRIGPVAPGSVADRAWLEAGDELLAFNGAVLDPRMTLDEVYELLRTVPSGPVELKCKRRDKMFSVRVEPELQTPGTLKVRYRLRHNIGKEKVTGSWVDLPAVDE